MNLTTHYNGTVCWCSESIDYATDLLLYLFMTVVNDPVCSLDLIAGLAFTAHLIFMIFEASNSAWIRRALTKFNVQLSESTIVALQIHYGFSAVAVGLYGVTIFALQYYDALCRQPDHWLLALGRCNGVAVNWWWYMSEYRRMDPWWT